MGELEEIDLLRELQPFVKSRRGWASWSDGRLVMKCIASTAMSSFRSQKVGRSCASLYPLQKKT